MERHYTFHYALGALARARTNSDLLRILFDVRDRSGASHLVYHGEDDSGASVLLGTGDPELCGRYRQEGEREKDPIIQAARRSAVPVDWEEIDRTAPTVQGHFDTLETFGLGHHGLAIPCFSACGRLGVTIFSTKHNERDDWIAFKYEHAAELSFIGMHFHPVATRIANDRLQATTAGLTPQAKQVLALLADGGTTDSIGEAVGLSVHTVRLYLNHAKERLGCRTRDELIAKALNLGLISTKRGSKAP